MAPPTAPAKIDGGAAADDANLPVADVVVADETVPIAEEEPIAVAESVETIEPLAAATLESDAVLAQRLQREEEQGALLVRPGPPAGRPAASLSSRASTTARSASWRRAYCSRSSRRAR